MEELSNSVNRCSVVIEIRVKFVLRREVALLRFCARRLRRSICNNFGFAKKYGGRSHKRSSALCTICIKGKEITAVLKYLAD